jgi:6-phosphogluconolactonase
MTLVALLFGLSMTPSASAETAPAVQVSTAKAVRVYIGTYTGAKSRGIYLAQLDLATSSLSPPKLAADSENPSFLAVLPSRRFLYGVNEVGSFSGQKSGAVSAFSVDEETGMLTRLNQQSSKGTGPCHLVVDRAGKNVLVANYGSGSVAVLPIATDGRLGMATSSIQHAGKGADPRRQSGPHAHSVNLDAANRFAVVADLGLDKLFMYRFDPAGGTLAPNDPPFASVAPGAGPRHFAFHPDGRHGYVINEMRSTITAFDYDPKGGVLTERQTITTLPEGFSGDNSTAEVQVHPSGKFLYGSNRGHNSIAMFAIEPDTGRLLSLGHESTRGGPPRNFGIDPSGSFLLAANQASDSIVVFRVDPQSGKLQPSGSSVSVGSPVCLKFVQMGD